MNLDENYIITNSINCNKDTVLFKFMTIDEHQKARLKNLVYTRIREDFPDYPVNLKRIGREEAAGADIAYCYGSLVEKLYRMLMEIRGVIDTSNDPYEDPAVHTTLEKYNYFISPTGSHIYGAGPNFTSE